MSKWLYLGDYCSNETGHEARAVKEHVKTENKGVLIQLVFDKKTTFIFLWVIELRRRTAPVGYKPQGVGPDPIEELDEGEGEVEEEEAEQVPRVWVGQDEADPVTLHQSKW